MMMTMMMMIMLSKRDDSDGNDDDGDDDDDDDDDDDGDGDGYFVPPQAWLLAARLVALQFPSRSSSRSSESYAPNACQRGGLTSRARAAP